MTRVQFWWQVKNYTPSVFPAAFPPFSGSQKKSEIISVSLSDEKKKVKGRRIWIDLLLFKFSFLFLQAASFVVQTFTKQKYCREAEKKVIRQVAKKAHNKIKFGIIVTESESEVVFGEQPKGSNGKRRKSRWIIFFNYALELFAILKIMTKN